MMSPSGRFGRVQDRFLAVLVASLTNMVRRIGSCGGSLQRVDEDSGWELLKLIPLLPRSQGGNPCFQGANFFSHFRFALASRKSTALRGQDFGVELDHQA